MNKMIENVNLWAVIVAALVPLLIGAFWYSPALFMKPWMQANGFTEADLQKAKPARNYSISLIFSLIMSFNLAMFLAEESTTLSWGMTAGALAGLGWVGLSFAMIGLFEMRSWKYILINGAYLVVIFVIMGAIIGGWR